MSPENEKKYNEVRQIIVAVNELLETMTQGMDHTQKQVSELQFESIGRLTNDMVQAVVSINEAIIPVADYIEDFNPELFSKKTEIFVEQLMGIIELYKTKNYDQLTINMQEVASGFYQYKQDLIDKTATLMAEYQN